MALLPRRFFCFVLGKCGSPQPREQTSPAAGRDAGKKPGTAGAGRWEREKLPGKPRGSPAAGGGGRRRGSPLPSRAGRQGAAAGPGGVARNGRAAPAASSPALSAPADPFVPDICEGSSRASLATRRAGGNSKEKSF